MAKSKRFQIESDGPGRQWAGPGFDTLQELVDWANDPENKDEVAWGGDVLDMEDRDARVDLTDVLEAFENGECPGDLDFF